MAKKMLVVARHKPVEALRVAAGLTLADTGLDVLSLGPLPDTDEAKVQLEALEFAELAPRVLPTGAACWDEVARAIVAADVVYML
ncbi:MAG: hypothetical protein IPM15_06845 [Betaproteobacteria bacterium]|jgi:hypothetical protein|nr:hypothetical protein [Betaproteobacteria bacterium]MCC6249284.1 hypothetical protein [Rubrivivax sp.]MCL4698744.1 hypothetical protein [Burkholderiaceae bacterium]